MNGYTLRTKGVRSKGSIIREMVLYGFSNQEIEELAPATMYYVKWVVAKMKNEYLFYYAPKSKYSVIQQNILQNAMFSKDEMDYGYSGQQKYTWNGLSYQEQQLIKKRNHNKLKQLNNGNR